MIGELSKSPQLDGTRQKVEGKPKEYVQAAVADPSAVSRRPPANNAAQNAERSPLMLS